jgi:hypothetical protein
MGAAQHFEMTISFRIFAAVRALRLVDVQSASLKLRRHPRQKRASLCYGCVFVHFVAPPVFIWDIAIWEIAFLALASRFSSAWTGRMRKDMSALINRIIRTDFD